MARGSITDAESVFLGRLAAGASLDELQVALREARAAAGGAEEVVRLEAMFEHAVALHEAYADARRQARGLAALSDTAADLATMRDLDALLHAVCRRARLLLGTDTAYITLRDDERGDTYVRMTDGIVSEGFRKMRLPRGKGLGGLVAATGVSETTVDYADDERFSHVDDVDRLVVAEGVRSIVAAPLRRGDDVLGVVMSGSRSVRRFEPSEVALLESLATHAAIAIENARLFATVNAHTTRIERSAALQKRLAELVNGGAGIAEVLGAINDVSHGSLDLVDDGGTVVARVGPEPSSREDAVDVSVAAGGEALGTLRASLARAGDDERELLERGAVVLAGLMLHLRARSDAELRLRAELVDELFAGGPPDEAAVRRRAARLGIDFDAAHVVVVALPSEPAARWAGVRAGRLAADGGGLAGSVDKRTVAVEPAADMDADVAVRRWSAALAGRDGQGPTLAVAGPAQGLEALVAAYRAAVRAVRILVALGREGQGVRADDLGIFGLVMGHAGDGDLRAFLERTLGPILRHDARRNGELLTTLETYFAQGGHMASTARELGIHINTVYQRLERLDDLLGAAWRTPDGRLELQLATRLRRLDERLAGGG